jgi:hypothetical protein
VPVREDLLDELSRRQFDCGAWPAVASSDQPVIESSCLAAFVSEIGSKTRVRAQQFLLGAQNPNGSWPALLEDDREGAWVTSLAVIALRDCVPAIPSRLRAYQWLIHFSGKEANWFWKWKFRTTDREVRFDPDQYGWPWFPGTVSWVVPTSFSILALNQAPCTGGLLRPITVRLQRGTKMLLDRACPSGGWNAGNGVVFGAPMPPHPDDTAVALLALTAQKDAPAVRQGLRYLEDIASRLRAPASLAWAVLALAAYQRPVHSLQLRLSALPGLRHIEDTGTLAAVCLALECRGSLFMLGLHS